MLLASGAIWGQEMIETLPPLRVVAPPLPDLPPLPKVVPITLDAVLRLAQDQNGQIRIARARLDEASIKGVIANQRWLPNITVGPSFYRHEGGIQDFQGNLIHSSYGSLFGGVEVRGQLDWKELTYRKVEAERAIIQRRGELAKLTSEQLLDAAGAYIDLLAAKTAVALSAESEKQLAAVLGQARDLAAIDPGLRIEAVGIETKLGAHHFVHRNLQEKLASVRLRLLYLLGLDPDSDLAFLDEMTMVKLVNDQWTPAQLVDQALQNGPGIAELTQLVAVVDRLHRDSHSRSPLLPTLEVSMAEGAYGAGPGSSTNWDNRFDAAVHLRWRLNDVAQKRDQQRLLDSQREQARLTYDDLRGKLTLGVRQALEEIKSGQDQMQLAVKHIQSAEESYRLSNSRLRENIKGRSPGEVLLAASALFGARMSYLTAIRDYDKAQLRLFILVGAGEPACR
jgi:multidrug efflux system outer membrane protein